jgi:hypothetical protein
MHIVSKFDGKAQINRSRRLRRRLRPRPRCLNPHRVKSSSTTVTTSKWYLNFPFNSPKSPCCIKRKLAPHRSSLTTLTPRTGLSTSAKIAIGVIIPIAFLAILLGLFLLYRKRRSTATATENAPYEKPELGGAGEGNITRNQQTGPVPQLDGTEVGNITRNQQTGPVPQLDGTEVGNATRNQQTGPVPQLQELVPTTSSGPHEIRHELY